MSKTAGKWIPGALRPGTVVGAWRVVEAQGQGAYGTVYRAKRVRQEEAGAFALKVGLWPDDPRFEREVKLLSRARHPSIPRMHDHGVWAQSNGVSFPFIVMDLVEGVPLYEWAAEQPRSSRQVMRVLVQVAGALDALHREGCVHRDVKGENVLVGAEGRAFLLDFGAGDYEGSRPLTQEILPPGTPEYRSPEALRFQFENYRQRGARYKPGPADDVYSLAVLAYRLVTGGYPPPGFDTAHAFDPRQAPLQPLLPLRALVTVSPELDALILRMLAVKPEMRGSAGEIARALERAASSAGHKADVLVVPRPRKATPRWAMRPEFHHHARWLLASGLAVAVAIILCLPLPPVMRPSEEPSKVAQDTSTGAPDASEAALGDSASPAAAATGTRSAPLRALGLDMPKEPLPGQRLPPCREGFEVEIELTEGRKDTRSCWIKGDMPATACKTRGYQYRGGCYAPSYLPPRTPQSTKP